MMLVLYYNETPHSLTNYLAHSDYHIVFANSGIYAALSIANRHLHPSAPSDSKPNLKAVNAHCYVIIEDAMRNGLDMDTLQKQLAADWPTPELIKLIPRAEIVTLCSIHSPILTMCD